MEKPKTECTFYGLYTITSCLLLLTLHSFNSTTSNSPTLTPPLTPLTFHPLRDPTVPSYTHPNKTWFMSTLAGRSLAGLPEHFLLPSPGHPYTLCIHPLKKSYALATPPFFPQTNTTTTTILNGLTFVADSFYDYDNPWHGLNAVSPFFAWMREGEGRCRERPKRFVLFKNGEVVRKVGAWVESLVKVGLGGARDVELYGLGRDGGGEGGGVVCFERALVMRRGLGGMEGRKRNGMFGMLRCNAWRHCGVDVELEEEELGGIIRVSLVGRQGRKRGFRNESGVKEVMESVCSDEGVGGCRLRVHHFTSNMSFCDQVSAMKNTDILASTHGAQLTNMLFMPKGSSVMEMFPTGWLESAGVGQFIYQWFANWTELHYEGAWRDLTGLNCSKSVNRKGRSKCFNLMQKDQEVRVDAHYLADWTRRVINRVRNVRKIVKGMERSVSSKSRSVKCDCDDQ